MENCEEKIDFKNWRSVLTSLLTLFKVPNTPAPIIPPQVVLSSQSRPGLSPSKISSRIIKRQSEAGIPVGPLPSGQISPSEIMERIRIEEIVNAIVTEARTTVAVNPGIALQAAGGNAGGPIVVGGTTLLPGTGNAVIQ